MTRNLFKPVIIVGAFPPPKHGMSMVNDRMSSEISKLVNVKRLDISPGNSSNRLLAVFRRVSVVAAGMVKFSRICKSNSVVYIGLSGGFGQLWELPFIVVSRLFKSSVFLHHHSYAYIDKLSILMRLLVFFGGPRVTHIILSENMNKKIRLMYPSISKTFVLSNAMFVKESPPPQKSKPSDELVIGFLSNISFDKGIDLFFRTVAKLSDKKIKFKAVIAGPCVDDSTKRFMEVQLPKYCNVNYLGSVSGKTKKEFFKQIDVLLFPTVYFNEAQPLVIFEALSYGVAVISNDRGSIGETVNDSVGGLVDQASNFSSKAAHIISGWAVSRESYVNTSRNALNTFTKNRLTSNRQLHELFEAMGLVPGKYHDNIENNQVK